jgi:hypothetical protein
MQTKIPGNERDREVAQLRATVLAQETRLAEIQARMARQQALMELLLAERTADPPSPVLRPGRRSKRQAETASPPSPESAPTSRRGLLKRLGASAAGAAVAATALGGTRPERVSADAVATLVGGSTNVYGVYASQNGIVRPALPAHEYGVVGINTNAANLDPLNAFSAGVFGGSFGGPGVIGASTNYYGILGQAGPNPATYPNVAGITGVSVAQIGTQGQSTNSHGVFGRTSAPAGTAVSGILAAGVTGRTGSTIALYGYADGPPNGNYAPVGTVGQCQNGFGVWGLSSAGPGAVSRPGGGSPTAISGVLGTSASGLGVYAISSGSYALAADGNGPTTVGALIRGLGGAQAAVFVGDVEIQGHLSVSGGINGPVAAQAGELPPTSLALVETVGRGQVERGTATVALDPTIGAQVQGADYDVFLTSYDNVHLHVANRTPQGFEVRVTEGTGRAADIAAGRATAAFSYRVVARRRPGSAGQRADATPRHVPTIPVPQGVPALPVGREAPPSPPAPRPDGR